MSSSDQIQRLLFDGADVRAVMVGLDKSFLEATEHANYPASIQKLLGELLAAVALLGSNLKVEGRISLQAQGEGDLRLLMAEVDHNQQVRAVARFEEGHAVPEDRFDQLFENGRMALTIEPDGGQRYQGVVPMEGATLAECLESYFKQSEQLPTQIHLAASATKAAGMLVQVLPAAQSGDSDWEHIATLASTLTAEELLELDNETILYRLFHEEQVRLIESDPVKFHCPCSRQRSANALQMMSEEELLQVAEEQGGAVETACHFCNKVYSFDSADIKALFHNDGALSENTSLH
jgi:molecular chaperone Hsp33